MIDLAKKNFLKNLRSHSRQTYLLKVMNFFMLITLSGYGQVNNEIDSINSFKNLIQSILETDGFDRKYARLLYEKAEDENEKLYKCIAFATKNIEGDLEDTYPALSDLMVYLVKNEEDTSNLALKIWQVGTEYYRKRQFSVSLDFYLIAHELAHNLENKDLIFSCNHSIGTLKNRIGEYESAYQIHARNFEKIENKEVLVSNRSQLANLFSLSVSCRKLGKYDLASLYNNKGFLLSEKIDDEEMKNVFTQHEGVVQYSVYRMESALDSLLRSNKYFEKNGFNADLAVSYFFIGNVYLNEKKDSVGIYYLKKVDSIFALSGDIHPETLPAYSRITEYYKKNGDLEQQLYYLNQQIKVDSALGSYKKYLDKEIKNSYDIPIIIQERNRVIESLGNKKKYLERFIVLIIAVFMVISSFLAYKNARAKKRFERLLNEPKVLVGTQNKLKPIQSSLSVDVIENILKGLCDFEESDGFISRNVTLGELAKRLDTNTSYLSKVINEQKGKNFSKYLNDLRIEYTIQKLKNSTQFRNYKISAMAREVGFNNTETFSKLFKEKNGIYLSYFVKQLKKLNSK